MSDRIREKMRRVEEFLEKQRKSRKCPSVAPIQKVKPTPPPPPSKKLEKQLVNFLKKQSAKKTNSFQLTSPRVNLTSLRERFFPPQTTVPLMSARSTSEAPAGSIVKNGGFMTQRAPSISSDLSAAKRVTITSRNPEVFCFQKYFNDPELEHCNDIEELQEVQRKHEIFVLAKQQLGSCKDLKLSKYEALIEKACGNIRKSLFELEDIEKSEPTEISRLSVLNSTLQNEIEVLKCKEACGKFGETVTESQFSFDKSQESKATAESTVSTANATVSVKPLLDTSRNNASWLKTWSMVEALQSKIVYGTVEAGEMNEFEKTVTGVSSEELAMTKQEKRPTLVEKMTKKTTKPAKVGHLRIECECLPQKESMFEPVTAQPKVLCDLRLNRTGYII